MNVAVTRSVQTIVTCPTDVPANVPLVIGVGQTLRRDDGVGWRVIERLAESHSDPISLAVVTQLLPEWSEPIARASTLVLVDACAPGTPGEIRGWSIAPTPDESSLTHVMTPGQILAYANGLWGEVPRSLLVTITGFDFGLGEGLSPAVERALPRAVNIIRAWLSTPWLVSN